jgi:hypothetical protein
MTKIRRLEPYGFNEQPQFNGLANTVKANIENIKEKNQEQDKKDESQDENIKQAIDKSVVSLELLTTPTEGSNRTYAVKQGGNEIGKIEIPFSSLVKSTTYDAENNLLIFTVENDKEIKVDLTNLIKDSDLVQKKIFDDFKNDVSSITSNLSDNLNELSGNVDDRFYVVSKALNELKDDLEDAIDESMVIKGMGENSLTLKDSDSIAKGKNSLALGTGVVALNDYEISLGKYNDSTNDTAFSFGIGNSENDRKNAIEIKNDGRIYIWSEGNYVCLNEIIGRVDVNETY